MARRSKYQSSKRRKSGGGGVFLWIVLLALVALGVWLWWRDHGRPVRKPAPASQPIVKKIVSTNVPAPVPLKLSPPLAQPVTQPVPAVPPPVTQPAPQPTQAVVPPGTFPRPTRDVLELQVALARAAISSGSIDGVLGSQTRAALLAYQRKEGLPRTGVLDANTRAALLISSPPLTTYVITADDLARLQPLGKGWLDKSQQSALEYETVLELVAEKGHASPICIRKLNPGVDWTNVIEGTEVKIPDVDYPPPSQKAAFVIISLAEKTLEAFDAETNLLAHFPCSIAARVEKRPEGELRVAVVAPNPNYTFNPEIFPESAEAQEIGRKLVLPPGPNNPVGVAWIGLDKPGYGIHGTPAPEAVGRTESHGCFRLANWNAEYLIKLVWVGMPVYVEQ